MRFVVEGLHKPHFDAALGGTMRTPGPAPQAQRGDRKGGDDEPGGYPTDSAAVANPSAGRYGRRDLGE